jgi:hypothetical protein
MFFICVIVESNMAVSKLPPQNFASPHVGIICYETTKHVVYG